MGSHPSKGTLKKSFKCWNSSNKPMAGTTPHCQNPASHIVVYGTNKGDRYYCESCAKTIAKNRPDIPVFEAGVQGTPKPLSGKSVKKPIRWGKR